MDDVPDLEAFNRLVWTIVKQIPTGKVSTYGQIASMIPPPDGVLPPAYDRMGAQWVGRAMNITPKGEGIPWQRVINSQGKISLPAGTPGAMQQRALLEGEGVVFGKGERVNFDEYGWHGPDDDFLQEYGLYPPKPLAKKPKDTPDQPRLF